MSLSRSFQKNLFCRRFIYVVFFCHLIIIYFHPASKGMTDKHIFDKINDIISSAKKVSKKIVEFDKLYQKAIDLICEAKPSSSRYIPKSVRRAVLIRDRCQCVKCGSNKNLQFDHDVAIKNGGSNTVDNIQLLCKRCNLKKGVS